jgi:peptidoglycan hydrolase-like protein with peptidoglycan-binding domain
MAFIQGTIPPKEARNTYNIDFPIGPGRFNKKDDVALVQKLLRYIYVETDHMRRRGSPMPRGTPDIVVDGKFGPTTSKYILHYKQFLRSHGPSVFPDAVILPFGPNEDQMSVVTKTFYTMRLLLTSARHADDEAPVKNLEQLPSNPDIPAELRVSLRVIKPQADGFEEGT